MNQRSDPGAIVRVPVRCLAVAFVVFCTACGKSEEPRSEAGAEGGAHHHHEAAEHWHFVDGRGILLSPHGRSVLGLEVAEVLPHGPDGVNSVVPGSAVLQTIRGNFVYVRNGDYLFRTPVGLHSGIGESATVVDGLFEGDFVATSGVELLWLTELQSINGGAACAHSH